MTTFVEKSWDNGTILVHKELLDRAKQLMKVYGVTVVSPVAVALETEFHYPPCSSDVTRTMVIASRELGEEGQVCTHRCLQGKHCGGCGCPGCGYTEIKPISTVLTVPAFGELQCLCRTQYHCEKHCAAGDHV